MKVYCKKLLYLIPIILFSLCCQEKTRYDVLILNGNVYDGLGNDPKIVDIGILENKIARIGDLKSAVAKKVINARDMAVTPGFIDLHAHLDPITRFPECESLIRQGVTTALGGPDGGGPWPLGQYLDSLVQIGVGMNVAYLVGHNVVRKNVMELENRAPTASELEEMKGQVKQAMKEGAFGISTGLKYLPGAFSEVDEVIELSRVASGFGGFYTSHLRDEGLGLIPAVKEAILISREANIPVVLTHHKVIGKPMWGKSFKTLALVDSARRLGLDIKMDQYPYNASYTGISVLIPSWARAGGTKKFEERVANPVLKDSIKAGIVFNILNDRGGEDLRRVQFAKVAWMPELEGQTLHDLCEMRNLEPTVENGAELVIEAQLKGGASCIYHAMDERDVEQIMQHPQTMIASDGRLVAPGIGHPHPRWYGTFPRVLGHYARDKKIISMKEAVYKMTGLPAKTMGFKDRGTLSEGMQADIVVFDPKTVIDKATFDNPHQYPHGIYHVLVNGKPAIDNGKFNDIRSGKVLRRE